MLGSGQHGFTRVEATRSARVIEATPRIGIDYAGEAAQWPLRYYLSGSPAVSGPRPLRRPAPQVKE